MRINGVKLDHTLYLISCGTWFSSTFPKNLGQEEALLIRTLARAVSGAYFLDLVKDLYCACAIAIKFVGAACKSWDGRGWESSKSFYMALSLYSRYIKNPKRDENGQYKIFHIWMILGPNSKIIHIWMIIVHLSL